jgi:hypothetical protein
VNGPTIRLIREDYGRGFWHVAWLDETGRCHERRSFSRTSQGRLFFRLRARYDYAADGALLHRTSWVWERYGRIEREESDLERGLACRIVWRGPRDGKGQAASQLIHAPRKPQLALLSAPMGDEPRPPEGAYVMDLGIKRELQLEGERQACLAEAKRRGFDGETMYALEGLLTVGLIVVKTKTDLPAFIAAVVRRQRAEHLADEVRST